MADFSKFSDKELLKIRDRQRTVGGVFGIGKVPIQQFQQGQRNIFGNIGERPGAAIRAGIRGLAPGGETPAQAYTRAAIRPGTEPRFQKTLLDRFWKGVPPGKAGVSIPAGMVTSAAGLAADIATNPADLALLLAGKLPTGGGVTLAQRAAATRPAQAIGRFGLRPRVFKTGEGLPTGKIFARPWTKFKKHPIADTKRIERAISGQKELATARKGAVKEEASRALQADKDYTTRLLNEADDVIKQNIEVMKLDLQKSAEKGSLEFQTKLQRFIKENSKSYGNKQDIISNALAKRGENLTKGEMNRVLVKTLQESIEAELPIGRAQNVIQKLIDTKYGTTQFSKNFTFTEIMNDIRMIRGTLASGVKAGRAGFAPDEVIVSILNKNWGDVVAQRVPEFVNLNRSYTPVIRAMKKSYKVFKPSAGPFETKTGTEFLKKVGTGKAEAGELRFLRQLERGSEFAPGVGKISQPVKATAKRISLLEAQRPLTKQAIQKQALVRQAGIQETLTSQEVAITKNLQSWLGRLSEIERKAVLNQWKRRGGMAAGGGMLLYLIKRQMADSVLNSLSGGGGSQPQGSF